MRRGQSTPCTLRLKMFSAGLYRVPSKRWGKVYTTIFKALFFKNIFYKVKVVILGQDPYHGPGQAHGMCFSVREGVPPPPSLLNIYKELQSDLEGLFQPPSHGYLVGWARQGVLLLNACLTVRQRQPKSHADKVRPFMCIYRKHVTLSVCVCVCVCACAGLGEAD